MTQKLQHYNTTHRLAYKIIHKLLHLRNRNKFVVVCWCPSHVGIKGNEAADRAARAKALSNDPCDECPVFYKDYFPIIRRRTRDLWAEKWRDLNNKLRTIRDNTHPWPSWSQYGRKTSIILTRLRIGHTLLTHGFLMDQSHLPYCNDCLVPLTAMHFMAECPSYSEVRLRCFPQTRNLFTLDTFREILVDKVDTPFHIDSLLLYLRLCNIGNL